MRSVPRIARSMHRGRFITLTAIAPAVLGLVVVTNIMTPRGRQRLAFPPPPVDSVTPISADRFVGSATCAECHEAQFQAWVPSTHGRAGGAPGETELLAEFDGTPIRFRDAVVTPAVDLQNRYTFTIDRAGRPAEVFTVDGVVGGGHMEGGGTQGFVSRFPDGTVRFLPFDFSRQGDQWFCNTAELAGWWTQGRVPRPDSGWVPVTEQLPLAACGDWPPIRILGTNTRFANCQQCHGSQIDLAWDADSLRYDTRYTSLAINCESCHGPGRDHVDLARSGDIADRLDIGVRPLATLTTDESLEVCFACHAVKRSLAPGYLPGASFPNYYALGAARLDDRAFLADGRVRTFAYQQNHLSSSCYLDGSMTCGDCHEPHGLAYRDIFGQPLVGRFDDGQCVDCHPSKAADVPAHTKHAAGSEGSRCVACHMPYLQHAAVGEQIPFARSDHTIPIPRPAFDELQGIRSACRACHATEPLADLAERTREWWGDLKPHNPLVNRLFRAESEATLPMPPESLALSESLHPMAQTAALAHLVDRFFEPDMPDLSPALDTALRTLATSADLDVRAAALAALHLARGEDPSTRGFLAGELAGLGGIDLAVRRRWVTILRHYGDGYLNTGDAARAVVVYGKTLELFPNRPDLLVDLAGATAADDDLNNAVSLYERALVFDPTLSHAWVNLAVTLEGLDRLTEALGAYQRAIEANPGEALAHFNLGNLFFGAADYRRAVSAYRRAVTYDPSNATAHLFLGQSYILLEQLDSALVSAHNALEFAPDDARAQRMVADLRRLLGR